MKNKFYRCFIALDLPAEIIKEIKKIQDALPEFVGKKIESENLHLTLKFFGEISEEKIEQIKSALKNIKFQKFETEIDSLGVFSEKAIRIVWLNLKNCDALQKEVDDSLKGLFKPEERFMGHLTIARVKNVKDSPRDDSGEHPAVPSGEPKKEFLEKLKKIKLPKMKFVVENFKLKSSILNAKCPVYEDIKVYDLR